LSATGGTTYSWLPAASLDNASGATPFASPTTTTNYSVTITDVCNNSATLTTTVKVLLLPVINAGKSNDIDCSNDQSQLTANGGIQYVWSPAATLSNTTIANPIAKPTTPTRYIVKGTNQDGCSNYDSVTVNVTFVNKGGYSMPSAFSPNNDGLNDCYGMKYWGVLQELDFSIYSRFGERVFHTNQPGDCWDGKYKGVAQDPGVFIYMIKAKTTCEKAVFRKGAFTLVR
jgi:gliding motility-associated-like protein